MWHATQLHRHLKEIYQIEKKINKCFVKKTMAAFLEFSMS